MDKFGIFNVLSSLLNNFTQNKGETNDGGNYLAPPPAFSDSDTANAEKRATFPPLQNSMLAVMKNHDEFLKRVKAKNTKLQEK